ncbi:MAG TPA: hypothetical protein VM737_10545 [Gemmatimonadota bacterium]|nr:hypothetical protein [Gemmatimonadota bacterium]
MKRWMMDLAVVMFDLLVPDSGVVSLLMRDVGSRVDQWCMCRKQKGAKTDAGERGTAQTGTEGESQHWGGNLTGLVQEDQPGGLLSKLRSRITRALSSPPSNLFRAVPIGLTAVGHLTHHQVIAMPHTWSLEAQGPGG